MMQTTLLLALVLTAPSQSHYFDRLSNMWLTRTTLTDNQTIETPSFEIPVTESMNFNCQEFEPWAEVMSPVSWIDVVRFFNHNGRGRLAITTTSTASPDPINDFHLFVYEYTGNQWLQIYSGAYNSRPNRTGLAVTDMNNDGLTDIIVGHEEGLTVFLDDGSGSYQTLTPVPFNRAYTLLPFDVDGDGNMDIVSLPWMGSINIWYGNGNGSFVTAESRSGTFQGYNDMAIGDISNDSSPELLVMSGQLFAVPNFTSYQLIPGLPLIQEYRVAPNENTYSILITDATGDSLNDVLLSKASNLPTILWQYTQSAGALVEPPSTFPVAIDIPESLENADINCDGRADVIVAHGGWLALGIFNTLPSGGYATEVLCDIPYASHYQPRGGIATGDADGDGITDVFVADYNNGALWLKGTGASCCSPTTLPEPLLKATKAAGDVSFSWSPPTLPASRIIKLFNAVDIPTQTGAVPVCNGLTATGCLGISEIVLNPELVYYQAEGACN